MIALFTSELVLLGLRMLDQPYMTDLIEANSMGHKPQNIHIYSASWGPTDDGKTVDGPRNATMRAIVKGVNEASHAHFTIQHTHTTILQLSELCLGQPR